MPHTDQPPPAFCEQLASPALAGVLLTLALATAPALAERAAPVTLAAVESEVLHEQAILSGTAIPHRRAELSPKVDGLVTELFVDEGSIVEAGDPILALDERLENHAVEAAAARVQEAERITRMRSVSATS
jgi:multidrug efflux pump subunit AcrA (membrane-fusion protein)